MAKTTISIVLSEAEIKALSAMQISENESLNKTAETIIKANPSIISNKKAGLLKIARKIDTKKITNPIPPIGPKFRIALLLRI